MIMQYHLQKKNFIKGKELIQSGNFNEAINALEISLKKNSDDSDALVRNYYREEMEIFGYD